MDRGLITAKGTLFQAKESSTIAMKAKMEMLEQGKVNSHCPRCNQIPVVKIEGKYDEYINVRCSCGYLNYTEHGV